jgi:hypothetical protein
MKANKTLIDESSVWSSKDEWMIAESQRIQEEKFFKNKKFHKAENDPKFEKVRIDASTDKKLNKELSAISKDLGIDVYLVNGYEMRRNFDIDWMGGHGYCMEAGMNAGIPKNEIWLDRTFHGNDLLSILQHELVERNLMKNHGFTYTQAHTIADFVERKFRNSENKKVVNPDPRPLEEPDEIIKITINLPRGGVTAVNKEKF